MEKENKMLGWLKKYGTYAVGGVLVVALATTILITGLNSSTEQISTETEPTETIVDVGTTPLSFAMPMTNATLVKDFSSEELFFNDTLDRWEFHDGIDLTSSDLKVFAVADGTVTDVSTNSLNGTVVTITHDNNLVSVYSSLSEDVLVQKGDKVKSGDQLGNADTTATNENQDGKHLHFSMLENGKKIDPANYLEFEVK